MDVVEDAVRDVLHPTPFGDERDASSACFWLQRECAKLMQMDALMRAGLAYAGGGSNAVPIPAYHHGLPPDTYHAPPPASWRDAAGGGAVPYGGGYYAPYPMCPDADAQAAALSDSAPTPAPPAPPPPPAPAPALPRATRWADDGE